MRIIIDMNLSPLWVDFFSQNLIDSAHWSSIGKATDEDSIIFDFAKKNDSIVFTNDLDFGTILAATNALSPSVIQVRTQDLMPDVIGDRILMCLKEFEEHLNNGCLLTLDNSKSRVRILPFY